MAEAQKESVASHDGRSREQALREKEQWLHLALESAGAGTWEWDLRTNENVWSDELWPLYGIAKGSRAPSFEAWREVIIPEDRAQAEQNVRDAAGKGGEISVEFRTRRPDGSLRYLLSRGRPMHDSEGRPARYLGVVFDITERKRVEQELRESQDFLSFALANAGMGAWEVDLVGQSTRRSLKHDQIFGYDEPLPRWTYEMFLEHVVPEDRDRIDREFRQAIETRGDATLECRISRHDGETRWIRFAGCRRLDAAGQPTLVAGVVEDITDSKLAQEALRQAEEKFFRAFHGNGAAMVITRVRDGKFIDVNERWQEVMGYSREQVLGRSNAELNTWKRREDRARFVHELDQHGMVRNEQFDFVRRNGEVLTAALSAQISMLQGEQVAISSLIDVTERRRAEEALRLCEMVVQQSRDVILTMNRADGRILEANPAATEAYGYSRDELLALTISDLRAPDTRGMVSVQIEEAATKGVLFETEHRRKDGTVFPVEVSSRGAVIAGRLTLVSVVRDISGRRRAEAREREQRLRAEQRAAELDAIFNSLTEPLVVNDAAGKILRANPAFRRLVGATENWREEAWEETDVAERVQRTRLQDADGNPLDPAQAPGVRALAGETVHGVLQHLPRSDGSMIHLSTSSAPIRTAEGIVGAVVVLSDVSERVRAEQALRDADQRKNEFLAMLSHELRNPLAPIMNSLHILEHGKPDESRCRHAQAVIKRQVGHLSRLVDDLLDVTRISRGKIRLEKERLDLKDVVERTVEDHRALFAAAGLELQCRCQPDLWGEADRTRTSQIVGNLLQNAVKFTPRGGSVSVSLEGQAGARAVIRVQDSGVGIGPELGSRLFEPFTQADRTLDRTKGGLGLGLALVKGLAELHGGSVAVHSDGPGHGATFEVSLPLLPLLQPDRYADSAGGCGRVPRSVLIIEDNRDAADSLREALELCEHSAQVAYSALDGIGRARAFRPDVVLCDIGLPEMDGYEVARTIRRDDALRRTTLVALTGYAGPDDIARAHAAGFDHHLAKPPSIEQIERVLDEHGRREEKARR